MAGATACSHHRYTHVHWTRKACPGHQQSKRESEFGVARHDIRADDTSWTSGISEEHRVVPQKAGYSTGETGSASDRRCIALPLASTGLYPAALCSSRERAYPWRTFLSRQSTATTATAPPKLSGTRFASKATTWPATASRSNGQVIVSSALTSSVNGYRRRARMQ